MKTKRFSGVEIGTVWNSGQVVFGYNYAKYRKDQCGAWISRDRYGDISSPFGWEVDHIKPVSDGGNDSIENLRPLQWQNNRSTSDGRLTCAMTSDGNTN